MKLPEKEGTIRVFAFFDDVCLLWTVFVFICLHTHVAMHTHPINSHLHTCTFAKNPILNMILLLQDKVIPDVPPVPEGYIPDLPPIPDIPVEVADVLNALGEPTLSSLGLINYTPPGLVQAALEYMHVSMGMPWWSAIVAGKF